MQSHYLQGAQYLCLLNLHLIKQPVVVHWFVINSVVMWLYKLVGPTNICSHHKINQKPKYHNFITIVTLASKNNTLPENGVTAPKHVGTIFM